MLTTRFNNPFLQSLCKRRQLALALPLCMVLQVQIAQEAVAGSFPVFTEFQTLEGIYEPSPQPSRCRMAGYLSWRTR